MVILGLVGKTDGVGGFIGFFWLLVLVLPLISSLVIEVFYRMLHLGFVSKSHLQILNAKLIEEELVFLITCTTIIFYGNGRRLIMTS